LAEVKGSDLCIGRAPPSHRPRERRSICASAPRDGKRLSLAVDPLRDDEELSFDVNILVLAYPAYL
jgi:hypothetical protein